MTPNLLIAVPCPGGQVSSLFARSVLNFQRACWGRNDIQFDSLAQWTDSLTTRAQQGLVTQFLGHPSATHLLLARPQVGFWPDQVFRLLKFDAEVAAAVLSLPEPTDPKRIWEFEPEDPSAPARDGFVRARWAGTGLMLLKRPALKAMTAKYADLQYRSDLVGDPQDSRYHSWALFNCMVGEGGGKLLGADESFCRRWTQMGGEIWVDLESALKGVGPVVQGPANYGSKRGAPPR